MKHDYLFRDIDHGLFKAFSAAAQELNFTRAAEKAAMTQSGVSQQIAKLETQLGTTLFTRINKRVTLTRSGQLLLQYIETQQNELDRLLEQVASETRTLSGKIHYAMPHSCLFTPHFPLLLKGFSSHPQVSLKVSLCPNH